MTREEQVALILMGSIFYDPGNVREDHVCPYCSMEVTLSAPVLKFGAGVCSSCNQRVEVVKV